MKKIGLVFLFSLYAYANPNPKDFELKFEGNWKRTILSASVDVATAGSIDDSKSIGGGTIEHLGGTDFIWRQAIQFGNQSQDAMGQLEGNRILFRLQGPHQYGEREVIRQAANRVVIIFKQFRATGENYEVTIYSFERVDPEIVPKKS